MLYPIIDYKIGHSAAAVRAILLLLSLYISVQGLQCPINKNLLSSDVSAWGKTAPPSWTFTLGTSPHSSSGLSVQVSNPLLKQLQKIVLSFNYDVGCQLPENDSQYNAEIMLVCSKVLMSSEISAELIVAQPNKVHSRYKVSCSRQTPLMLSRNNISLAGRSTVKRVELYVKDIAMATNVISFFRVLLIRRVISINYLPLDSTFYNLESKELTHYEDIIPNTKIGFTEPGSDTHSAQDRPILLGWVCNNALVPPRVRCDYVPRQLGMFDVTFDNTNHEALSRLLFEHKFTEAIIPDALAITAFSYVNPLRTNEHAVLTVSFEKTELGETVEVSRYSYHFPFPEPRPPNSYTTVDDVSVNDLPPAAAFDPITLTFPVPRASTAVAVYVSFHGRRHKLIHIRNISLRSFVFSKQSNDIPAQPIVSDGKKKEIIIIKRSEVKTDPAQQDDVQEQRPHPKTINVLPPLDQDDAVAAATPLTEENKSSAWLIPKGDVQSFEDSSSSISGDKSNRTRILLSVLIPLGVVIITVGVGLLVYFKFYHNRKASAIVWTADDDFEELLEHSLSESSFS